MRCFGRTSASKQLVVRSGKGDPGRVTMLPRMVVASLRAHLQRVKVQHERDLAEGAGRVPLPGALARKYKEAASEWRWQWVFPATRHYVDPRTGLPRNLPTPRAFGSREPRGDLLGTPTQSIAALPAGGGRRRRRVKGHDTRDLPILAALGRYVHNRAGDSHWGREALRPLWPPRYQEEGRLRSP